MGIGAAFIYPTTLSILTNTFHGPASGPRPSASGRASPASASRIGPLLGGFLVEHFAWGAVFLVNVRSASSRSSLGCCVRPDLARPRDRPLDPFGALLSIFALVALLYAIIQAPDPGGRSRRSSAAFVVGVGAPRRVHRVGAAHARSRCSTCASSATRASPRRRPRSRSRQFALFGSTFLLTQYFQFVLGYSAARGRPACCMPVAHRADGGLAERAALVGRWGTKRSSCVGLLRHRRRCVMLCYASDTIMSSFVGGCAVRLLFGVGIGLTMAPATESIMGSLPPSRAGVGLGGQRHHPSDGRRARRRRARQHLPRFHYHRVFERDHGNLFVDDPPRARTRSGSRSRWRCDVGGVVRCAPRGRARTPRSRRCASRSGSPRWSCCSPRLVAAKFLPARAAETDETLAEEVADSLVVGVQNAT